MNDTQEIIQRLHTQMQNTMTAMPADAKTDCLAALQFPGVSIDPSEYDETGLSDSLIQLLDSGVHIQAAFQPADSSLYRMYGQILDNTKLPASQDLSTEEQQRLKIAQKYIRNNSAEYQKYYDRYLDIQTELMAAKSRTARTAAQMKMKRLTQEWSAHGRQKYEEYSNIIRELHISSPASYFTSARENYELYTNADVLLAPAHWYDGNPELSWTSMSLSADSSESSASSQTSSSSRVLEKFYQTPGIWSEIAGWFGIRKGKTVTTELNELVQKANTAFSSSNMNMTWKMMPVTVRRPWLDLNVLALKDAKISGTAPGAYSTGELSPDNRGTIPGYITSFIVAKDIQMTMTLSKDIAESLKENSSSITCGLLSNGKTNSINIAKTHEDRQKGTSDVTISADSGVQLIGYIIRPFPRFPSA